MVTPVHISQTQPTRPNREVELENKIRDLEQQNEALNTNNFLNQLIDEKVFRYKLLQSLENISTSLNTLTEKVIELSSQPAQ